MTAVVAPQEQDHYKIVSRVISYPLVSNAWTSASQYYSAAKEKSSIVKYGCGLLESNIELGRTKLVEPVLNNEMVKKYSEPILSKVDEFGCRQLDKIESVSERIVDQYSSSKQMLETKVTTISHDIKATSSTVVEIGKHTLEEKVVPTVDNYLKNSVLSVPINVALDVTEKVCDKILPPPKVEEQKEEEKASESGPVLRAGRLGKKLHSRAFAKLKDTQLALRSPEKVQSLKYTVDLIQYAATQLDSTAKAAQTLFNDTVQKTTNVAVAATAVIVETQQKNVKEVKTQVVELTASALAALHSAIDALSKQVPEPVATASHNTYESLKQKTTAITTQLESIKDYAQLSVVAKKSSEKLQEATVLLQQLESKVESYLPATVVTQLHSILDTSLNLLNAVLPQRIKLLLPHPEEKPKDEGKEEKEEHVLH